MTPYIIDWINLLARWAHVIVGIAWIGSSFYFIFTDASLKPNNKLNKGVHGETWQVHGGGFYHIQKYLLAPEKMPNILHWFKYEAYMTWVSGMVLMVSIYYVGADAYLIDKSVMDLSQLQAVSLSIAMLAGGWFSYDILCKSPIGKNTAILFLFLFILLTFYAWIFTSVFGSRAAFLHAGALIGTMMVGNVFFIIIPNQKKTVAALITGQKPAAYLGMEAKQRSLHNSYLTLPVLLIMISNHFPMIFANQYSWLIFAAIVIIGAVIRHYFIAKNLGSKSKLIPYIPYISVGLIILLAVAINPAINKVRKTNDVIIHANQAFGIIRKHCNDCHSSFPTNDDFDQAPNGISFDDIDQIRKNAEQIIIQSITSTAMPLGNPKNMTLAERKILKDWLKSGSPMSE